MDRESHLRASALSMEDHIKERQLLEAENQRLKSFVKIDIYPKGLYKSTFPLVSNSSVLLV